MYTSIRNAHRAIRNQEAFSGSNFHGKKRLQRTGRLPESLWPSVRNATYVVYSYDTPIGWFLDDEWVIPDVKYSVTTSRHQSALRNALNI